MDLNELALAELRESPVVVFRDVQWAQGGTAAHNTWRIGSREDLIAEGYATAEMFPAHPRGSRRGNASVNEAGKYREWTWSVTGRKDGRYNLRTSWWEDT